MKYKKTLLNQISVVSTYLLMIFIIIIEIFFDGGVWDYFIYIGLFQVLFGIFIIDVFIQILKGLLGDKIPNPRTNHSWVLKIIIAFNIVIFFFLALFFNINQSILLVLIFCQLIFSLLVYYPIYHLNKTYSCMDSKVGYDHKRNTFHVNSRINGVKKTYLLSNVVRVIKFAPKKNIFIPSLGWSEYFYVKIFMNNNDSFYVSSIHHDNIMDVLFSNINDVEVVNEVFPIPEVSKE